MFIMSPTKILTEVIREWSEVFMQRSMRDFKRFMDTTGLSFSQINILMRLFHCGSTSVSEIGELLGVTNAAASQAVDRLVGLGLIERTEDPEDRRTKRLELTEGVTNALNQEQQKMIISALILLTEAAQKTNE
jgi:DNA-binding MarR family transcriptional regulator